MFQNKRVFIFICPFLYGFVLLTGCRPKDVVQPIFVVKDYKSTGLDFNNKLTPTQEFNILKYMYYYNGAGIGAGDFNNDGKIDLFFAANQGDNKLYLNEGNLHFKDVTQEAGIPNDGGWSTGVSVVDINNDGLLDIYICRVGNYETLHSKNQLLICQGIDKNGVPYYKDEAHEYGLDFSGFSTQAVFFDYDGDGDLDMFLLNHSIHQNGTFGARSMAMEKQSPVSGDRLYQNNGNGHFTDVTKESGINSSILGYGLGVSVADLNLDGWPDIYVGNDFHENDYMYINQHNGTFREELNDHLMHTSEYTMGVDIADANNDGYPDIISMDMLASDPYILKRSLGDDEPDVFFLKRSLGYNYQYSRNNLQLNRRNGMFSEVGLYAGVAATDWSWSPLWMDFDNDGLKDLFISNGIPKRLNDMDYINFISNDEIQEKLRIGNLNKSDNDILYKFPEIKIFNKFYKNDGNMQFGDLGDKIENDQKTFSNGAVYGDFDNDGDLDVVVNNIDEPALLYENKTNDRRNGIKDKSFVELKLKGPEKNINAIGAKVILFCNGRIRTYEKYPVRGFMSSMETPVHIGLEKTKIDSAFLVWPDNTYQSLFFSKLDTTLTLSYQKNLPVFNYSIVTSYFKNPGRPFRDITNETKLTYRHRENTFQEFNREPLIPHMLSTEGPALAVSDINRDGLDDIFVGASKTFKPAVFIQKKNGTFIKLDEPDLDKDSMNEEVDACWADINNDGFPDLIVANGGNEFYGRDKHLTPCVYINNGKGLLTKLDNPFDSLYINASSVCAYDFNGDGYVDLFIGGRSVPGDYGKTPRSYLLLNDKKGHFIDVTNSISKGLSDVGMVTDAQWFDINKDGEKDLLVTCEWGGITAFINQKGIFTKKVLTDSSGWWNFLLPVDVNNDGNYDLIAGNLGLNSRLKASPNEPVRLYYNDFDDNGKKEQVVTYYLNGQEIPFANKDNLERQMPVLKKKYLYAKEFAKATLKEIFSAEKLSGAKVLKADYFPNSILINDGKMNFKVQEMPWEAQLSPFRTAVVVDANNDSLPDILLMGNFYENNIQMGRNDADFGTILINKGKGQFEAETINGLTIKGQVRHIAKTIIKGRESFILAMNNDSLRVITYQ